MHNYDAPIVSPAETYPGQIFPAQENISRFGEHHKDTESKLYLLENQHHLKQIVYSRTEIS